MHSFFRRSACVCSGLYLATCLIVLMEILGKTHGHFCYSLDDPFIHLALAERITTGLYGLNLGEPSSPSSSILWPLLLSLFARLPFFLYVPLLLNLIFGCAAAWLIGSSLDQWQVTNPDHPQDLRRNILGGLLLITANLVGLTFTGMEHVLQVLLTVCAAIGLLHALRERPIPLWCIAATILNPSIRYEGLLISLAVAFALAGQRRRLAAALTIAGSIVLPIAFSLYLHSLGLGILPNSVLAKARTARKLLQTEEVWPLLIIAIVLLILLWRMRSQKTIASVLLGATSVAILHTIAGPFGWFYRYEVYALIFTTMIVVGALLKEQLRITGTLLLSVAGISTTYVMAITLTPFAANNIYRQQIQMARFAQSYPGNIAVNDIGAVSFHRDSHKYVLDLLGLASTEALKEKSKDANWLDHITREHQIGLVMLYPEWFPDTPASWHAIGKLCIDLPLFTVSSPQVVIYTTALENSDQITRSLQGFVSTLPKGTHLDILPRDTGRRCQS